MEHEGQSYPGFLRAWMHHHRHGVWRAWVQFNTSPGMTYLHWVPAGRVRPVEPLAEVDRVEVEVYVSDAAPPVPLSELIEDNQDRQDRSGRQDGHGRGDLEQGELEQGEEPAVEDGACATALERPPAGQARWR